MQQSRHSNLAVLLIAAAVILRLAGMFDDFSLDEVWSWSIAQHLQHATDVLLHPVARIDNNHPLNTLLIWLIGDQPQWWMYRVPSVLAGAGSLWLTWLIARRRDPVAGLISLGLVGFSFPLISYGSEARGYSMVVFFALLAFDSMERVLIQFRWRWALLFWVACVFGILAHLTFFFVYAGLAAWSLATLFRSVPVAAGIRRLLAIHCVPMTSIVTIHLLFIRHLVIGGSPAQLTWDALAHAIAGLFGWMGTSGMATAGVAIVVLAFFGLLLWLTPAKDGFRVFLVTAAVIAPVLVIVRQMMTLQNQHQPIGLRYFLVVLPFLLIGFSFLIARGLQHRRLRLLVGAIVVVFVAMNLLHTYRFLRVGRGHYADAIAYLSQQTPKPVISVLSDHPHRTSMMLRFYARLLLSEQSLHIEEAAYPGGYERGAPDWFVVHSFTQNAPPGQYLSDPKGTQYVFDREFTYYGLSGSSWYIYRRRG